MKYETDFYNEFLISVGSMITEKIRNWLVASRLSAGHDAQMRDDVAKMVKFRTNICKTVISDLRMCQTDKLVLHVFRARSAKEKVK
ncbi:MAG: hypothetical protein ACYSUY_08405 [Planctomycetota bacterium]